MLGAESDFLLARGLLEEAAGGQFLSCSLACTHVSGVLSLSAKEKVEASLRDKACLRRHSIMLPSWGAQMSLQEGAVEIAKS